MVEREHAAPERRQEPGGPPRMLLMLGAWALLVGALQLYTWREMLTSGELFERLIIACKMDVIGPLLFIGVAMFSPLLLLPAALLGGGAGYRSRARSSRSARSC